MVICIQMAAFVDLKQTIASRYCKQMPTHKPAFKSSVYNTAASRELGEFMRSTRIIILSSSNEDREKRVPFAPPFDLTLQDQTVTQV